MQRVTRAEAARQLGVNRSTVTRWCNGHPALVDENDLVSVDELRAHREAVIDPRLQTNGARPAPQQPAAGSAPPAVGINDHKARHELARAQSAELDLAERLGMTIERRKVAAAVAEAAEMVRQAVAQAARDQAERLAAIEDAREMEHALMDLFAGAMEAGSAKLAELAAEDPAEGRPDAA
jgi:parvulin-like peptidyl-prolyl isomerase